MGAADTKFEATRYCSDVCGEGSDFGFSERMIQSLFACQSCCRGHHRRGVIGRSPWVEKVKSEQFRLSMGYEN